MHPSVADQSVSELGGPLSVLVRQKSDHVTLDGLLHDLDRTEGDDQEKVLLRLYRLVFPHAFAEESVLWPLMRRVLDDGPELTLEVEREHQEVNELVTRLERMERDDQERPAVLTRLAEVLREDVRDEEDELFPRLQSVVSPGQLRRLGLLWEVVRRVAPTRAHPVVARRPPGNVVAALPLSVVDRLRDGVDWLRFTVPSAPLLASASRGLTSTAHAIEHLPFMKSGEDESTRIEAPATPLAKAVVVIAVVAAGALVVRAYRKR